MLSLKCSTLCTKKIWKNIKFSAYVLRMYNRAILIVIAIKGCLNFFISISWFSILKTTFFYRTEGKHRLNKTFQRMSFRFKRLLGAHKSRIIHVQLIVCITFACPFPSHSSLASAGMSGFALQEWIFLLLVNDGY